MMLLVTLFSCVKSSDKNDDGSDEQQEEAGSGEQAGGDGAGAGSNELTPAVIIDVGLFGKDTEGNSNLVVSFVFTNETDQPMAFSDAYVVEATQGGTVLERCVDTGDEYYDSDSMAQKVAPGETAIVIEAYLLNSLSGVTIEVRPVGASSESPAEFSRVFYLTGD